MKYLLFSFLFLFGCKDIVELDLLDGDYFDAGFMDSSVDSGDVDTEEIDIDTSDTSDSLDTSGDVDTDVDSDIDTDVDSDADSDSDSDSDSDEDTDSIFDGLCDFITCPEFPTHGQEVKFRSLCVPSDFPNAVPDTIVHYAAGSGECFEIVGGYECLYQEHIVECELEQRCGQQYSMDDPGYTTGVCLDRNI